MTQEVLYNCTTPADTILEHKSSVTKKRRSQSTTTTDWQKALYLLHKSRKDDHVLLSPNSYLFSREAQPIFRCTTMSCIAASSGI